MRLFLYRKDNIFLNTKQISSNIFKLKYLHRYHSLPILLFINAIYTQFPNLARFHFRIWRVFTSVLGI